MAISQWDLVTINGDTTKLGEFWSQALDLIELERENIDRWVVYGTHAGTRILGFQRGRQQAGCIHLDLRCAPEDFVAEVARLLSLGARLTGGVRHEPYGSIANLADPQGNLFDLCAYIKD